MAEKKNKEKNVRITDRSAKGVDMLLKEIRGAKPLTKEQEYNLWQQMKEGDNEARSNLIRHNMLYVVKRAKDFQGSKAALEDLIQAGNEGLVQAADKFDASLGGKFLSFASYYIDNEIRRFVSNHKKHHCPDRLDAPLYPDSNGEEVVADSIESDRSYSADWNMRMRNALDVMKRGIDKRWYNGAGELLEDYICMKMRGLSDVDFMRKNRLNRDRMESFLDIAREEGNKVLKEKMQDYMVDIPTAILPSYNYNSDC